MNKIELPVWDGISEYQEHITIKGRNCWIKANGLGHLCGYVEISDEELFLAPRYEPSDNYPNFDVHGGITWEGGDIKGIQTQEYSTLIGFDTAHLGDTAHPNSATAKRHKEFERTWQLSHPTYISMDTYKDEQFVLNELIDLVDQVDQIHVDNDCKRPGE